MLKKTLFLITIITSFSCSSVDKTKYKGQKIVLTPYRSYMQIFTRSGFVSQFPNGILHGGIHFKDQHGKIITDNSKIKSTKIIDANGDIFFNLSNENYAPLSLKASGYDQFTVNRYVRRTFYNSHYNKNNTPIEGTYYIEIVSVTGHKTKTPFEFRMGSIQGFPTKIKYNQKTRKINWNPTNGQIGYRVVLLVGEKEPYKSLNLKKILYVSTQRITNPEFILPANVRLKTGETYSILVLSHNSDDGSLEKQNYAHLQDNVNEIAIFTAN